VEEMQEATRKFNLSFGKGEVGKWEGVEKLYASLAQSLKGYCNRL